MEHAVLLKEAKISYPRVMSMRNSFKQSDQLKIKVHQEKYTLTFPCASDAEKWKVFVFSYVQMSKASVGYIRRMHQKSRFFKELF